MAFKRLRILVHMDFVLEDERSQITNKTIDAVKPAVVMIMNAINLESESIFVVNITIKNEIAVENENIAILSNIESDSPFSIDSNS